MAAGISQGQALIQLPTSTPAQTSPVEALGGRLAGTGLAGINPAIAAAIMLDGLPLTPDDAPVRRASPSEILAALRVSCKFKPADRDTVREQVSVLFDAGVLVGKRAGTGSEPRYSLTAHPENIQSESLREAVQFAISERGRRLQQQQSALSEIAAPAVLTGPKASAEPHRADERRARQEERVRQAVIRDLDTATKGIFQSVGSLAAEADSLVAAIHIGRAVARSEQRIYSPSSFELTQAQEAALLGWIAELPAFAPGAAAQKTLAAREAGPSALPMPSTLSVGQIRAWNAALISPLEKRAQNLLSSLRAYANQAARGSERAALAGVFDRETAEELQSGFMALQKELSPAALRLQPGQGIQSLVRRDGSAALPCMRAAAALRRVCGLAADGEQELQTVETAASLDRDLRRSIRQQSLQLIDSVNAWKVERGKVNEEVEILQRAYVSSSRPEDGREAVYWDQLKAASQSAIRAHLDSQPDIDEQASLVFTIGGLPPPTEFGVGFDAEAAELDRIEDDLAGRVVARIGRAMQSFRDLTELYMQVPYSSSEISDLLLDCAQLASRLERLGSAEDSDESAAGASDLDESIEPLIRLAEKSQRVFA